MNWGLAPTTLAIFTAHRTGPAAYKRSAFGRLQALEVTLPAAPESRNTAVVLRASRQTEGGRVGRTAEGVQRPSHFLATANAIHARDSRREAADLFIPCHSVHVPSTEHAGWNGRATDVARNESHAPGSRIRRPRL